MRKSFLKHLQNQFLNTPSYVVYDWFYKNNKNESQEVIDELIVKYKNIEWTLKKNFPISLNILSQETKKLLKKRDGGKQFRNLKGDAERHQTQKKLIIKNGLPTEAIIILDQNGKYELVEGWHRIIQLFILYPKGFKYPNVYVGKTDKSIYT